MEPLVNLEKFLEKNNLKIKNYFNYGVNIQFINQKEADLAQKNWKNSRIEAENTKDEELQDKIYLESWDKLFESQKVFYPLLLPIVNALNDFYSNRETGYQCNIFVQVYSLNDISIVPNEDIMKYFKNDKKIKEDIQKEFKDFDEFLISFI